MTPERAISPTTICAAEKRVVRFVNCIAVFPSLADVVKVMKGSGSTAHWPIDFIRLSRWLRRCFTQLITPLDIDGIGQSWEESNIPSEPSRGAENGHSRPSARSPLPCTSHTVATSATGAELEPHVAAALAAASHRVAAPEASLADTAAVAAVAVLADDTGTTRPPLTATAATVAVAPSAAPCNFLATAALFATAGLADAADVPSCPGALVVVSVAATAAGTPTSANVRAPATTAAAASAAGAVGRTAALATVAAIRRAASQAARSATNGPTG